MSTLTLTSKAKHKLPLSRAVLLSMKDAVLGKDYELSVAFVSPAVIRTQNRIYRGKDEATDILSFSLDEKSGEILLCPDLVRERAEAFGRTYVNFAYFLFIHGLVHLKGFDHGSRMESEEEKIRRKFNV